MIAIHFSGVKKKVINIYSEIVVTKLFKYFKFTIPMM